MNSVSIFFFGFALGFFSAVVVFDIVSRCLISDSEIKAWKEHLKRAREEAEEEKES